MGKRPFRANYSQMVPTPSGAGWPGHLAFPEDGNRAKVGSGVIEPGLSSASALARDCQEQSRTVPEVYHKHGTSHQLIEF